MIKKFRTERKIQSDELTQTELTIQSGGDYVVKAQTGDIRRRI